MDAVVVVIFAIVYLGMIFGGIPGLALDRTGTALVGAVALIVCGRISPAGAWQSVDVPTIVLLFAMMIVSAQFRLGGFYSWVARSVASVELAPAKLLALLIAIVGPLSAILGNDIICLAMTPVLIDGCVRRRLNPVPFLFALACATNVGSAATLIGNPQNILIGERMRLSFGGYLLDGVVPAMLGLVVVWAIVAHGYRKHWITDLPAGSVEAPPLDQWQSLKGGAVTLILMVCFLASDVPRDVVALIAAASLLLSRRTQSRDLLALVDWPLLMLFMGLFAVNQAMQSSGSLDSIMRHVASSGVDAEKPANLFLLAAALSNLVSNVPAVMLLLPSATDERAGPILALSSTLAGNLFVVGSIANIIVFEQARRAGVRLRGIDHARVGVPVTIVTLSIAAGWLWIRSR